jgi:rubrerythrin
MVLSACDPFRDLLRTTNNWTATVADDARTADVFRAPEGPKFARSPSSVLQKEPTAMRTFHEQLLNQVIDERERIISRRSLLKGTAATVAGAAALGVSAKAGGFGLSSALAAADAPFKDDIEVLNYALTLEHLEYAFYRDTVSLYTYGMDAYGNDIGAWLTAVGDHEKAHVDTLTQVISDLGGTPVEEAKYDFKVTDAASALATAAALENTGVMAYDGAGQYLTNLDLITAAGSIVAVEARHASYLNLITGAEPAPDAFEQAKSPDDILKIAGPFIVQ